MIDIPQLRAICVEAMETSERLPEQNRPTGTTKTYWPEWTREDAGETFPVRLLPSADQISLADRFFEALNKLESEYERKQIYTWGRIKTSRNRTIRGYAEKMGLREHEYRREIDGIFQKVARHFRIGTVTIRSIPVEQAEEMGHKTSTSDEARASHWMADGAKPRADYEIPERQNCMKAMLARAAERMGEAQTGSGP